MHQQAKLRRTMGLVVIWMSAPSVAVGGDLQERQDLLLHHPLLHNRHRSTHGMTCCVSGIIVDLDLSQWTFIVLEQDSDGIYWRIAAYNIGD